MFWTKRLAVVDSKDFYSTIETSKQIQQPLIDDH